MPLGLWGDIDGRRLHESYFERFPGAWCHGDWATQTDHGSFQIWGRSDATLDCGGVRLGTAELYSVMEGVASVSDNLIVHLEDEWVDQLVLFISMVPGQSLTDELKTSIRQDLAAELSRRHVPDVIVEVPVIPRTATGKRLEVPIKRILQGAPLGKAISRESLADPEWLRSSSTQLEMAWRPLGIPQPAETEGLHR